MLYIRHGVQRFYIGIIYYIYNYIINYFPSRQQYFPIFTLYFDISSTNLSRIDPRIHIRPRQADPIMHVKNYKILYCLSWLKDTSLPFNGANDAITKTNFVKYFWFS